MGWNGDETELITLLLEEAPTHRGWAGCRHNSQEEGKKASSFSIYLHKKAGDGKKRKKRKMRPTNATTITYCRRRESFFPSFWLHFSDEKPTAAFSCCQLYHTTQSFAQWVIWPPLQFLGVRDVRRRKHHVTIYVAIRKVGGVPYNVC